MPARLPRWREFLAARGARALSRDPAWLLVLAEGMQHEPCCLEARVGSQIVGLSINSPATRNSAWSAREAAPWPPDCSCTAAR